MEYEGIEIGDWEYDGPKKFVTKLIDAFGTPKYIEKDPTTNEAYSVTYKNVDGEQVPSERRISVDDAITIQGYSGWYNKKDSSEKTFDWAGPYKIIANL